MQFQIKRHYRKCSDFKHKLGHSLDILYPPFLDVHLGESLRLGQTPFQVHLGIVAEEDQTHFVV